MEITPASNEDISQIFFLENAIEGPDAASLKTLQARRAMFNDGFLVAKVDSYVVGYIETCIWGKETPEFRADPNFFLTEHAPDGAILYIIFVAVEEKQRRQGFGSHLIRQACKVGQDYSAGLVHVVSRDPIIPLYESLGFSAKKQLPGFLPDKQNYTLMEFCLG